MTIRTNELFTVPARTNIAALLQSIKPGLFSSLSVRKTGFVLNGADISDAEMLIPLIQVFKEESTERGTKELTRKLTGVITPP